MTLLEGKWEIVVGMEVHAQILTRSKLFSGSDSGFGGSPNDHVSFVDAAMPGMLPVLNEECVKQAIRAGLALGAKINRRSIFARKHYFYPDLPQGYQISQYDEPIVGRGCVKIETSAGEEREIGIERAHLEQDAGKSLHDQKPGVSLIDLNRSGVALLEIVSDPDLRTSEECGLYVSKVRSILRAVGVCDGNMAEGSLRADVNLSLRRVGEKEYGTRTEMKNLNSVKFIRQAVEIEARRQMVLLERGESIRQETRLFDPVRGETRAMRGKEDAHDYRYFPCPDLLPVLVSEEEIEEERKRLPELPDARRDRVMREYGLGRYEAGVLSEEAETVVYFEKAVGGKREGKMVANWMLSELFAVLNKQDMGIELSPVSADRLGMLVGLIGEGKISGKVAKQVFAKMLEEETFPDEIVKREGWEVMNDTSALEVIIDKLLSDNFSQVESYRGGKDRVLGWFVGQVMKETRGTASPEEVNRLLREKLKG